MKFIGKWQLSVPTDTIMLDVATKNLVMAAPSTEGNSDLNAYGTPQAFVLQAEGGKYITSSGQGYAATLDTNVNANHFELKPTGASFCVIDHGPKGTASAKKIWQAKGKVLIAVAVSSPQPANTTFTQKVITPGIGGGIATSGAKLAWVDLSGENLTSLVMIKADLTGAVLADCNITGVTFVDAKMTGVSLKNATGQPMTDFTRAVLINANLDGAKLDSCTLTGAKLDGATGKGATFTNVTMTQARAVFSGSKPADFSGADFSGFSTLLDQVNFTGAILRDTTFMAGSIRHTNLQGCDLTRSKMSNKKGSVEIDFTSIEIDQNTILNGASLQYTDLSGKNLSNMNMAHVDLTGSNLSKTTFIGTELPYATLAHANISGAVKFFGANLANADASEADLTQAQFGAIALLFSVDQVQQAAQYSAFLNALKTDDGDGVIAAFAASHTAPPNKPVIVRASRYAPDRVWTITAKDSIYTVRREIVDIVKKKYLLAIYEPKSPAVLTNAYMKDTILTSANLYRVRASGLQLFGKAKLDSKAILEGIQLDNSNLAGLVLSQAKLYGANLSYSVLDGAQLDGAKLTADSNGGQASLTQASLAGVTFEDAELDGAIFTDAAVAVATSTIEVLGIWLFDAPQIADDLNPQLEAASKAITLDAAVASDFTPGLVSDALRTALKQKGVTLNAHAIVNVEATGPRWQITDGAKIYIVSHGVTDSGEARPALSVSIGINKPPTFSIPLYLSSQFLDGTVTKAVVAAFKKQNHPIATTSTVTRTSFATDWQIADGTGSWVAWLQLGENYTEEITMRSSMPAVNDLFVNHSLPLSRRATVRPALTPGLWTISNDANNVFNPITNYIEFRVIPSTGTEPVNVYGSLLRVRQVDANGISVLNNVPIKETSLPKKNLADSTVCPNSSRVSANESAGLNILQWMRARRLPSPPQCVPDVAGNYFCPPPNPAGSAALPRLAVRETDEHAGPSDTDKIESIKR